MSYVLMPEDLTPDQEPWVLTSKDVVAEPALKPKRTDRKVDKPTLKKIKSQSVIEASPSPSPFEGYDVQAEGGQPQVQLQTKPANSLDFRSPEVSIKTVTPKLKLTPTKAKKREDETFDQYNIRRAQFEDATITQPKKERAAMRAKLTPNRFNAERKIRETLPKGVAEHLLMAFPSLLMVTEAAPIAFGEGIENTLRPVLAAGEKMSGTGTEYLAQENQLPRLSEADSKATSTQIYRGLGSTVPFALTAAMTGTAGTALLGASSNAAQTYEEALARGVSQEDALAAAIPGALIGSLEGLMGLGTGKFVGQMGRGSVKSLLAGIGEEEFQELTSQTLNNVNAKILSGYDPKRAISEGLYDTFVTTLGTAGLAHGATMVGSQRATQTFEALKPAEQLEVGNALADPSPKSLASLGPKVREAALLNWHMEAHPSLKEEDGRPKTFYHGTLKDFDFFDTQSDNNIGSHFGSKKATEKFTAPIWDSTSAVPQVLPVYLNIKNPAVTPDIYPMGSDSFSLGIALEEVRDGEGNRVFNREEVKSWRDKESSLSSDIGVTPSQLFKAALESKGFDGIQYTNWVEDPGHTSHIVFYPHQVKSAFAQEFDPQSIKISASFRPTELQEMEQRALQAGKPVALRPETRDAYTARNQEIKQQLMTLDPSSGEFAKLADEHTRLARAIDDAPDTVPDSTEALRQHLIEKNLGHEGAADEMLAMLRPSPDRAAPLAFDLDKFEAARASDVRGARFYPLTSNSDKGGTVYLTPQTFEDVGLTEKGERSDVAGLNVELGEARKAAELAYDKDPAAAAALMGAVAEAESKGLSKISLIAYSEGQGFKVTRQLMRHESFHTGQQSAADESTTNFLDLHPRDIVYNPIFTKAIGSKSGQGILKYYNGNADALAMELAAYSAAGQYEYMDLTAAEAATYLTDYLTGIAEEHGPQALEALAGAARLSPSVAQKIKDIKDATQPKPQLGRANRDFAAQLRSPASASTIPEGPEGSRPGGERVDEGGNTQGVNQGEAGGVAGGPPTHPDAGPDSGGSGGNLYERVIANPVLSQLQEKFAQLIADRDLTYDPTLTPHENLQIALANGELPTGELSSELARQGLSLADFAEQLDESAAIAGKQLQVYSRMQGYWNQLFETNPKLAKDVMGSRKFIKQALTIVEASELGQSLWNRIFKIEQGNAVSHIGTLFTNLWGTGIGLPISIVDGFITGMGLRAMDPKRFVNESEASMAERAHNAMVESIQPAVRVALNLGSTIGKVIKATKGSEAAFNTEVIAKLQKLYPDLIRKLKVGEASPWDNPVNPQLLDLVKDSLEDIKNPDEKLQLKERFEKLQARQQFNRAWYGRALKGYEMGLGFILKPVGWQEGMLRNPAFVGYLDVALREEGLDIRQLMRDDQMRKANYDKVNRAVKLAGDLTWGARPEKNNREVGVVDRNLESAASSIMEGIAKIGPLNPIMGELLAGPIYNGLKFTYEWNPLGAMSPGWRATREGAVKGTPEKISYTDANRLSRALLGTALFAAAYFLRKDVGGENWWEIKTGKKDKKGQPVYSNWKNVPQIANFLFAADLIQRIQEGRINDYDAAKQFGEVYSGMRRVGDAKGVSVWNDMLQMWSDDGDTSKSINKLERPIGNLAALPLRPLLNLRDLIAQVDANQDVKLDMKEHPMLGPIMDTLPWMRHGGVLGLPKLEPYQPPTEPAGQEKYGRSDGFSLTPPFVPYGPASAMLGGFKADPATNFATREFSRLGISPIRWLKPDPDPKINRAQYAAYAEILGELAPEIERDISYQQMPDAEKAARWEKLLSGKGFAAMAKAAGEAANPEEMSRRALRKTQNPLQRKASGLDKTIQDMKNSAVP